MFSFLNHPNFFLEFGRSSCGNWYLTCGPAICRVKDTVIATFIVFSISLIVFNKIGYSFAMYALFFCNFTKRKLW